MELNSSEIQKILPHRYPFLMVDKIIECEPWIKATGIKCISANEMQFLGHFPNKPIMPGVLIIEALAQTGAVALLSEEGNEGKIVLFGGIRSARFKRQIVPGDVVTLSCEIIKRKGPVGIGRAVATVETFCMEIIYALKKPTNNEFARVANISSPNAAYKVNNLIKKGYINKVQSKTDKREYNLEVTERYLNYYNISYNYIDVVMKRIEERFSPEELVTLEKILKIMDEELMPEIDI